MLDNSSTHTNSTYLFILRTVGIGQIQYIRGDHTDSVKTYMTSLNFARSKFGGESLEVAACMNCIGVLHYIMPKGDSETALEALKTSVNMRIAILGEEHIDVGTTWNNIGRIYFQQGEYEKGMDAYAKALRIRRNEQGDSVDVAATIFNIGQVYHQQGIEIVLSATTKSSLGSQRSTLVTTTETSALLQRVSVRFFTKRRIFPKLSRLFIMR